MTDRKTHGGKGDRIPGANQSAYEAGYAGIQWGDGVDASHFTPEELAETSPLEEGIKTLNRAEIHQRYRGA